MVLVMKKILICCGIGNKTSKIVASKLNVALQERKIEARVIPCKELEDDDESFDLVVTTGKVCTPRQESVKGRLVIQSTSFLTGIGIEEDIEKVIQLLSQKQLFNETTS